MVLQGESLKAGCYVNHGQSLGILREKMVHRFIQDETPERLRVGTGLIRNHNAKLTSKQCDILTYDANNVAPLYRHEDFAIVADIAARAVIEVKSNLYDKEFKDILGINQSLYLMKQRNSKLFVPLFGYGLVGATFGSFSEYVQKAITENLLQLHEQQLALNWPYCVAVQERGYIGFCPIYPSQHFPDAFCILNFQEAKDKSITTGLETGFFLELYGNILGQRGDIISADHLYEWFNKMPIEDTGKHWVTTDGALHTGEITPSKTNHPSSAGGDAQKMDQSDSSA